MASNGTCYVLIKKNSGVSGVGLFLLLEAVVVRLTPKSVSSQTRLVFSVRATRANDVLIDIIIAYLCFCFH